MSRKVKKYQKLFFFSLTFIALGVAFKNTLGDENGSLGTVFIAVGGLFLIMAMARKKEEKADEQ